MKFIYFLCFQACLLWQSLACEKVTIDSVTPDQTQLIKTIETTLLNLWKNQDIGYKFTSEKEKEEFLEKLWENRYSEYVKGKSSLLFAHRGETPICSIFYYPSTLTNVWGTFDVVVNVGLVPLTKDFNFLNDGVTALTEYGTEKFPKRNFLSYMPKANTLFEKFLLSQKYEKTDLSDASLTPVNLLQVFPTDIFQWWVRKANN